MQFPEKKCWQIRVGIQKKQINSNFKLPPSDHGKIPRVKWQHDDQNNFKEQAFQVSQWSTNLKPFIHWGICSCSSNFHLSSPLGFLSIKQNIISETTESESYILDCFKALYSSIQPLLLMIYIKKLIHFTFVGREKKNNWSIHRK